MANTTIGTNIVTDGSTEYEVLKSFLDGLLHLLDDRNASEYARNLKTLSRHLDNGGKLNYKLVENKYVKELEQALKDANVPYILLPNENGETAIAVRDTDKQQFLDIQQRVFSKYTDYWKEQAVENIIDNVKADPEYRHAKIPVLTFEDNNMRLIAAQKLYGNGVVTGYKDNKTIIHPASVYSRHGDLIDAQLDMAMEQAKGDGIKGHDLLTIRKEQAKYDQEMLSAFCHAFTEKKSMSLWDAGGRSGIGLSINRNGDIELCTPKEGYKNFAGEESVKRTVLVYAGEKINETELFGMLSKHAGRIYNTVCCTNAIRDDILSGKLVKCPRPQYKPRSAERVIHDDIRNGLQAALDSVKAEAYQRVEDGIKNSQGQKPSNEKLAEMKENAIITLLTDRSDVRIQSWLCAEVKKDNEYILTRADKEAFLDKIIEHFKDNHENSRDEMRFDIYTADEVQKLFKNKADVEKGHNDELENESEKADDIESR